MLTADQSAKIEIGLDGEETIAFITAYTWTGRMNREARNWMTLAPGRGEVSQVVYGSPEGSEAIVHQ